MRVLLTLHHYLNPDKGAAGVTLNLGAALSAAGCDVDYFGYDQAFGGAPDDAEGVGRSLQFPWRTAAFLKQNAHRYDILDTSSGDAWVWARLGRPGAKRAHVLAARSHGLEHTYDLAVRTYARQNKQKLSVKYPFYHGGYRLWEVAQSIQRADCCFLYNHLDQVFAHQKLGIPAGLLTVLPNGVSKTVEHMPPPLQVEGPLRLAFVGSWIPRKGIRALVAAAARWQKEGIDFQLTLLGTGFDTETVLADFAPAVRPCVQVTARYNNRDLPVLLMGQEILLFPSLSEGFSLSLIDSIACGLAPIATPVGGAPDMIQSGLNGIIVPIDDSHALAEAVLNLSKDRNNVLQMRLLAHQRAAYYRWDRVAAETIKVYEAHLASRTLLGN